MSSAAPGAAAAPSSSAFDDTLASLIQPSSSRVGLKLMRKMGWREGQGVGPRVTHRQRQKQAAELGVRLDAEDEGDDEADKHYYAPLDRPLTLVKGTSASMDKGWGLGYQPGASLDQRLKEHGSAYSSSARAAAYELDEDDVYGGSGMGIGAMGERQKRAIGIHDEDEGDESFGSMRSSRDRRREQVRLSSPGNCLLRLLAPRSFRLDVLTPSPPSSLAAQALPRPEGELLRRHAGPAWLQASS